MTYVLLISLSAFMMGLASFVAGMILVTMWYELPSRKMSKLEKKMHRALMSIIWDDDWEDID